MGHWEFCRLCTKCSKSGHSNKLFDDNTQKLIKKIEDITGIKLINSEMFPQYICKFCEDDLEKAYQFRERCIFAQEYFNTLEFKAELDETIRKNTTAISHEESDVKDELPIEESEITDMSSMKEESCDAFPKEGDEDSKRILNFRGSDQLSETNEEITYDSVQTCPNTREQTVKSKHKPKGRTTQTKASKGSNTGRDKLTKTGKNIEKNQTFICDQCGNNFTCKHHFITHLRRHTGDKRHQCELCPDKFFTNSELNRHMRKHTGERPFACKHCGRRFTDYSTRIKHERTHTNERPFVCTQCTKAFTTSYILKNHMLVHTGERSFRCDLCNRSFQRQTHLAVHARSIMHKQNEEKQRQRDSKVPVTEHVINDSHY